MDNSSCTSRQGTLPSCAGLGLSYTPMQTASTPAYDSGEALRRGTLFPGLDLPFMNVVNTKNVSNTPLGELQAMYFVCHELQLYLDTHRDDTEAFKTFKAALEVLRQAREKYVDKYGPISVSDLACADTYTWYASPWPWEYTGGEK